MADSMEFNKSYQRNNKLKRAIIKSKPSNTLLHQGMNIRSNSSFNMMIPIADNNKTFNVHKNNLSVIQPIGN